MREVFPEANYEGTVLLGTSKPDFLTLHKAMKFRYTLREI